MTFPVWAGIAIILVVYNHGQIFFIQLRPGLNEKVFKLYKFKTMRDLRDKNGNLLSDDRRVTRLGRWLRSTSLDELPQLINVFKGEMSIIGPRPWLIEYLPHYSFWQRQRHKVKPGLTGLSQVKGRNALDWQQRLRFDIFYIHHISPGLDLMILISTLRQCIQNRPKEANPVPLRFDQWNGK